MDYSKMLLPELKAEAKTRKIKGFSTMNKATLIEELKIYDGVKAGLDSSAKSESFVDAIKAAFANARQERANKGRKAGSEGNVTAKQTLSRKIAAYSAQRNGGKLTAKQLKRYRKSAAQSAPAS